MASTTVWLCGLIMVMFAVTAATDVQKLTAKRPFCKIGRKYFMNGKCRRCLMNCPEGQMLNMSYTITMGPNGAEDCRPCMICPAGTFKSKKTAAMYADGQKCLPERNCTEEGMEFVRHTDGVNQSECGDCLPGYYSDRSGYCFPCTKWYRHEPSCMSFFTTTFLTSTILGTIVPATFEHNTRAHGTKADVTRAHSYEDYKEKVDSSHYQVFGIIGGVALVLLFAVVLVWFLKKKCASRPDVREFGSSASQRPFLDRQCDLETDGPDVVLENLDNYKVDFLTIEEEDFCRKTKLERRDQYISIIGKKVNKSLKPLYQYLQIPENVIYQNEEIYEYREKNIPEKEVQILNEWLQLKGDGHTLFELYIALKNLGYIHILHHLIPIIRANIHDS